jgi:hypothetical protein
VFIDDATSRLMHLQLVESESTFAYFHATRAYLEAWGKPVAFYSDKHGVFRVNHPGALGGRACPREGGGHDPIRAGTACAEHRHHLRQFEPGQGAGRAGAQNLARPSGQGAANALLPAFVADYNARFAKPPANKKDLHRPLPAGDDLEDAFAWKEERTLSQALTLQYDKMIFILEPSEQAKHAAGREQGRRSASG